jgi:lipoprotein-releasing system permease protein
MQSIYPELVLTAPADGCFDYIAVKKTLTKNYGNQIAFTAPAHIKRIILRSPSTSTATSVATLKAISPHEEPLVSSLEKKLLTTPLAQALADNSIIIGKKLAEYHDLKIGDTCSLLFSTEEESDLEKNSFETVSTTIGGIMETGIMQYDKYTVLCSLETVKKLMSDENITQIGLKLRSGTNDVKLAEQIYNELGIEVDSWKTLYPALVSVTKLEKYVMFLLLILVTLIASANIIALIFMQITQKRTDIALLKILGLTHVSISAIFIFMGTFLAGSAALLGLIVAIGVGLLLEHYPFITLPDAYLCTHLPVFIDWNMVVLILITVLCISFFASFFAAYSTKHINCSQTLRFEG